MFTINDSHMIFGFSDMECNRQNVLSFWNLFCPFTPSLPPNNPENQNFEKLKKALEKNFKKIKIKKVPGDVIILHMCTKNYDHMLYCSLDMAYNGFNCYFSFWAIFQSFTSLTAQKIKILKKQKKTPLEISSFYNNVPKIMIICYTAPQTWCVTDVIIFILSHFLPFYLPNRTKNKN